MKLLLFLLLVGCAVKCDESTNFVVQMPVEDTPVSRQKDLKIYWNVPTKQCRSKKIPFENLSQFGIIQNKDDMFRGEEITILYDPGYFPALLRNDSSGELKYRNGGVPQEGDLDLHLKSFASDLHSSIPDRNFRGVGIIDFESWRPVFRQNFGEVLPYQSISCDIERRRHWWWTEKMIREEARRRFEESAQLFMQYTISLARRMRPQARWGYYGFPYCFNTVPSNMNEDCPAKVVQENNQIDWLWKNSTALYPSVYSSKDLTGRQLVKRIRGRIREAARVRRHSATILPYFSFVYRDSGYFSEADLYTAFDTFTASEASGVIIWGSSNDVNTVDKCEKLHNYVYTVFGPLVAKYTSNKKSHKPEMTLNEDNNIHENNIITENNITSTTLNELYYNIHNETTSKPIISSELSTQNILNMDIDSYLLNINETTEIITTSSPFSRNDTEDTNTVEIEILRDKEADNTTKSNIDYINITSYLDRKENSTVNTEYPTKDVVQLDDKEGSTIQDSNFSSITTAPVNLTSDTTLEQATGWAAILNTIFTIVNGSNDENSTRLETDPVSEAVNDLETSTYLETELLMNNLSDFNLINIDTTESSESSTLLMTEETDVSNNYFETINSNHFFEIIFNEEDDVTTSSTDSSKTAIENVELTTKHMEDPDNVSDFLALKSLKTDNIITNISTLHNDVNTTDTTEDTMLYDSKNFTEDYNNMLQNQDKDERDNETETTNFSSTTQTNENWSITHNKFTSRTETKINDTEITATDALLNTNNDQSTTVASFNTWSSDQSTMEDIISTLFSSEPEKITPTIETNKSGDNNDTNDYFKIENITDDIIIEDYLDYENEKDIAEKNMSSPTTSLPESYSTEAVKQVAGSAAPTSRFRYIFCAVIYFSVSKCLCDYYGQCE